MSRILGTTLISNKIIIEKQNIFVITITINGWQNKFDSDICKHYGSMLFLFIFILLHNIVRF